MRLFWTLYRVEDSIGEQDLLRARWLKEPKEVLRSEISGLQRQMTWNKAPTLGESWLDSRGEAGLDAARGESRTGGGGAFRVELRASKACEALKEELGRVYANMQALQLFFSR